MREAARAFTVGDILPKANILTHVAVDDQAILQHSRSWMCFPHRTSWKLQIAIAVSHSLGRASKILTKS